jgi:hypothetical protein
MEWLWRLYAITVMILGDIEDWLRGQRGTGKSKDRYKILGFRSREKK